MVVLRYPHASGLAGVLLWLLAVGLLVTTSQARTRHLLQESRCGLLAASDTSPRMRTSAVRVYRTGKRALALVPGPVSGRAELRVRVRLRSGQTISRRGQPYACVAPGLRDPLPIALTLAGERALRRGVKLRVEISLRDDNGHSRSYRRVLSLESPRSRRGGRCPAERSITLLRDGHARVYLDRRYIIIACHLQTGRRTTIGPSSVLPAVSSRVASGVTRVRLAGPFVASVYVDVREGGRLAQLSVQDTRTSRQTRYAIAGGGVGSYGDITDLELTPGGAVVFIDGTQPQPFGISPSALTVRSYDRRGLTVLDDSQQAHAYSLSLDGIVAQWRTSSGEMSAAIAAT